MEDLTRIEKIDVVFKIIYNGRIIQDEEILNRCVKAFKSDWIDFHAIIKQLLDDGYIYRTSQIEWSVTFKGYLFYDFGSYVGQESQKILSISTAATFQVQNLIYRNRLLYATWTAGIAAGLLLLWQVFVYLYPVHANYPYWIWETTPKKC
jgi:hypothetical protein